MKPLDQIVEDSEEYWNLSIKNKARWTEIHKPKVRVKHMRAPDNIGYLDCEVVHEGITYWIVESLTLYTGNGWGGRYLPEDCEIVYVPPALQPKLF